MDTESEKTTDLQQQDKDKAPKKGVTAQLRGEAMAFGAQSLMFQLAGNLFEPYVNYEVQRYYATHDPKHLEKHGTYKQNLGAEIVGDVAGAGGLILAEVFMPGPVHYFTRNFRKAIDPIYDPVARWVFRNQKDDPDYKEKMETWKVFQERNLARSVIVAAGNIAGNVWAQKHLMGNPSPTKLIFLGKLASTSLVTGLGLVARAAFPEKTSAMDEWMSKKLFAPIVRKVDPKRKSEGDTNPDTAFSERLIQEVSEQQTAYTR